MGRLFSCQDGSEWVHRYKETAHIMVTSRSKQLTRPFLYVLPLFVKIPFVIAITTRSRPVTRDEKHVWPVPPSRPNEVRFELYSRTKVCVRGLQSEERSGQIVAALGGMHEPSGDVDIESPERGWFPSETDPAKGVWKQEVFFSSWFELKSTPSFQTSTMSMEVCRKFRFQRARMPDISASIICICK